jgi:hypothetical protein
MYIGQGRDGWHETLSGFSTASGYTLRHLEEDYRYGIISLLYNTIINMWSNETKEEIWTGCLGNILDAYEDHDCESLL